MNQNEADNRAAYWDRRIRSWSQSSYSADRQDLMSRARKSIDARKEQTKLLLRRHMQPGFTLVDLGCGAGQLAIDAVRELGASHAVGRDFSSEAIRVAEENRIAFGVGKAVAFEVADTNLALPPADVVTGLGLLDWLSDSEIDGLFLSLKGRRFVLSYSEQDNSPAELVHRAWLVWRLAITRSPARARHHTRRFIFGLVEKHGISGVEQVAHPSMRFGRLIHNLPAVLP